MMFCLQGQRHKPNRGGGDDHRLTLSILLGVAGGQLKSTVTETANLGLFLACVARCCRILTTILLFNIVKVRHVRKNRAVWIFGIR